MAASLRLLLWLALSLAAAGCGGSGNPDAGSVARAELDWVSRYSSWAENFQLAWARAGRAKGDALVGSSATSDLRSAFGRLRTCASWLSEDVGAAPTPRLRRAETLMRGACASIGRAVDTELGGAGRDPGRVLPEANAQWERASELWILAEQRLRELLGDARPLPVRSARVRESHVDPRYGRAAAEVTHDTVEVRCWSKPDWKAVTAVLAALDPHDYVHYAGVASPDQRRVSLAPWICADLARLAYSDKRPSSGPDAVELAAAVLTLAHEAIHVRAPGATEAETECYALQEIRRVAQALGATPAYAGGLAHLAWTEVYQLGDEVYWTPACRSGGPLDVDPERRAWP